MIRRSLLPLALASASAVSSAAVVESGLVNLTVPNNSIGLYLNVVDGTTYTGPNTFPTLGGPGANYDVNIYGTNTYALFAPGTSGQSAPTVPATSKGWVAATTTGPASNLAVGSVIGGGSTFSTSSSTANLTTGTTAYLGFRFRNEGPDLSVATDDTVHYGYAEFVLTNGQPGTLVRYAYESTPLTAITVAGAPVPEPATMAALGLGAAALLRRRRRA